MKRGNKGSVVLEGLLGLAILALVLGVVARGMVSEERMSADARAEVAARQVLLSEVERLQALPFDALTARRGKKEIDAPESAGLPKGAKLATDISPDADDAIWRMAVAVRWQSSEGHARERQIETLRARAGGPR